MFSQKSSTMIPVRDQPNLHFLEHNQSSGIMASSEDTYTYSQSMQCSNVYQEHNNWQLDNSSQSQDMNLKTYVGKPLLFSGRIPMQCVTKGRNNYANNSIGQFYDIQRKKNYSNEKEMLSDFVIALKEYSEEIKGSLEGMKSNISAEFQSNVEAMMSSFNNTGEILKKFQDDIMSKLESENLNDDDKLKKEISQKDTEIAVKDEKIIQMRIQMDQMSSSCELAKKKETQFHEVQQTKMKEILSRCYSSADSIEELCNKEVEHNFMLDQLLQQNRSMSQNISAILSWQKATNHILTSMNTSLTSVSANVNELSSNNIRPVESLPFNHHSMKAGVPRVAKPVTLPTSNHENASLNSPLPQFTRWFDVNGKPSPAAFVPPVVREKTNEVKPCQIKQTIQPTKRILPTFDMSSDSDSGHEMSEIIDKVINDFPMRRKTKSKVEKSTTEIKATPTKVNRSNVNSTPLQRSIRRYGRVKKKPFSSSPMKIVNTTLPNNVKLPDTCPTKHVKKKFITLEEHWSKANVLGNNSSSIKRVGKVSDNAGAKNKDFKNPAFGINAHVMQTCPVKAI